MGQSVTGSEAIQPGEVKSPARNIALCAGQQRRVITVVSRSARPIRVCSHYPFWRANARLEFDRAAARGYRLDIPAGTSVRWLPGQGREVTLVALGGVMGPQDGP